MNKGNTNGSPMATRAPKYFGPTVGEKLEILERQLECAMTALDTIRTKRGDAVATMAMAKIFKLERSWRKN